MPARAGTMARVRSRPSLVEQDKPAPYPPAPRLRQCPVPPARTFCGGREGRATLRTSDVPHAALVSFIWDRGSSIREDLVDARAGRI
eukprot:gene8095-biopygen7598